MDRFGGDRPYQNQNSKNPLNDCPGSPSRILDDISRESFFSRAGLTVDELKF